MEKPFTHPLQTVTQSLFIFMRRKPAPNELLEENGKASPMASTLWSQRDQLDLANVDQSIIQKVRIDLPSLNLRCSVVLELGLCVRVPKFILKML